MAPMYSKPPPANWDQWKGGNGYGKDNSREGEEVEKVNIVKDFFTVHPDLKSWDSQEIERRRLAKGIEVEPPMDVAPIPSIGVAPFPDWVLKIWGDEPGWEEPTPIQSQVWPIALKGKDIVGIAPTGSGKTMAYVLPMLIHMIAQIEPRPGDGPIGLVLLPTRELCDQVSKDICTLGRYSALKCESIYGGGDIRSQGKSFLGRVDVVTGTTGRLKDLLERRLINLHRVSFVVIDEADEMLKEKGYGSHGFGVPEILDKIRSDRQVLLFSATWDDSLKTFVDKYCYYGCIKITVGCTSLAVCKDVQQMFWTPGVKDETENVLWPTLQTREEVLLKSLEFIRELMQNGEKAIVFVNKTETVPKIAKYLGERGIPCEGFDSQSPERGSLLERFRAQGDGSFDIIVATDVLSRGFHFPSLKYVVNFETPSKLTPYVHRVGRTGRAGNRGMSLTLMGQDELYLAKEYRKVLEHSEADVPKWMALASNPRQHDKYKDVHRKSAAAKKTLETRRQMDEDAANAHRSSGKARLRVNEFLEELRGQGFARSPQQFP